MFDDVLKFTKSKWYDYFLIFFLIFAIALVVALYLNFQYLEQFKPIATLQFPESEWIKINDANMYTKIGSGAISPNEQVVLSLNITNKVPLNIMIEPEFHTYQAGKLVDIRKVSHTVYGFEHTSVINHNYFPTKEGLNIIKVPLKISYSNGTFLTYQNATTSFDVISTTDELQIQQNHNLFWGVFASAVIGIGTITALILSVVFSKKEVDKLDEQNISMSEQFGVQNRPWIVVNNITPTFASYKNRDIPWDEYLKNLAKDPKTEPPKEARVYVSCTNVGKSPAKIIEYRYTGNKETTFEKLKQNKNSERMLFPNQDMGFVARIPYVSETDFFIAYLIEYSFDVFGKKGTDVVGTQWRYQNSDIFDIDHWPKD